MHVLFVYSFSREKCVRSVVCIGPGPVKSYGDIIHSTGLSCNDPFRFFRYNSGRLMSQDLKKRYP